MSIATAALLWRRFRFVGSDFRFALHLRHCDPVVQLQWSFLAASSHRSSELPNMSSQASGQHNDISPLVPLDGELDLNTKLIDEPMPGINPVKSSESYLMSPPMSPPVPGQQIKNGPLDGELDLNTKLIDEPMPGINPVKSSESYLMSPPMSPPVPGQQIKNGPLDGELDEPMPGINPVKSSESYLMSPPMSPPVPGQQIENGPLDGELDLNTKLIDEPMPGINPVKSSESYLMSPPMSPPVPGQQIENGPLDAECVLNIELIHRPMQGINPVKSSESYPMSPPMSPPVPGQQIENGPLDSQLQELERKIGMKIHFINGQIPLNPGLTPLLVEKIIQLAARKRRRDTIRKQLKEDKELAIKLSNELYEEGKKARKMIVSEYLLRSKKSSQAVAASISKKRKRT